MFSWCDRCPACTIVVVVAVAVAVAVVVAVVVVVFVVVDVVVVVVVVVDDVMFFVPFGLLFRGSLAHALFSAAAATSKEQGISAFYCRLAFRVITIEVPF